MHPDVFMLGNIPPLALLPRFVQLSRRAATKYAVII
jgi:hypothetical protein